MKKHRLRIKLTVLVATIILLTVTVLGIALAWGYARDEQKRLEKTLFKELEIVSYATSAGLEFNDLKTVEESVSLLKNVKELDEVKVLDRGGKIFLRKSFQRVGQGSKDEAFAVEAPVMNGANVRIGKIEVIATSRYLKKDVERFLGLVSIVAFAVVLLALLFVMVFLRQFFTPLARLKNEIDRVAEQGFIGQVTVMSGDEVGDLATSFNAMSESLRETSVSRNELVKEMEERKLAEERLKKIYEDLKKTQSSLVHSEKMASIGQLAAGIAHEINNPTGFIGSNLSTLDQYMADITKLFRLVETLKMAIAAGDLEKARKIERDVAAFEKEIDISYILTDVDNLLRESKEGISRIGNIVRDLKMFSHAQEDILLTSSLCKIIDGVINIVWNEIKYTAELKKEYVDDPQIGCNPQQIGQVFINLLVNAVQAIKGQGVISIRTYADGGFAHAEISDTGCGIPEENMGRIFDAFFTTKEPGKGTGLGLGISATIVKKHGGTIDVKSQVGVGTTFTVSLPLYKTPIGTETTEVG
jgi:signal transduction histidine kinase